MPLAAGTVSEIAKQLRLDGSAICPAPSQQVAPGACWSALNPPVGDLLVAVYPPDQCFSNQLVVAIHGGVLTLLEWTGEYLCPPGSGARARQQYWLIGIPKVKLPTGEIVVRIEHQDDHPTAGQIGATGTITINIE
jgi:hypothetical protein